MLTNSSMPEPAIKPFHGIIFNKNKIDDISLCVCPPYDVISSVRSYYERNPFNIIRLELPLPMPSMNKYSVAKNTFNEWMKHRILIRDSSPTIYTYEQNFQIDEISYVRRGFIALNKLVRGRILTHEETRKKAREDRLNLIRVLKTFISLIFGLYEDKEEEVEHLLINSEKNLIHDFIDEQNIRNRFYKMTDINEMQCLASLMEEKKVYIADGHHRLAVSYKLNLPYIPLYLTNMYSSGIVILPYHRIITTTQYKNLEEMITVLKKGATVEKFPFVDDMSMKRAHEMICQSKEPRYILYSKKDTAYFYIITVTSVCTDRSLHEGLQKLKVTMLHNGIVKNMLHIDDKNISFTHDFQKTIAAIRKGTIDSAFFLPPTTVDEVKDIAEKGLYMPPKSTFFYPKILTGLVLYKYE